MPRRKSNSSAPTGGLRSARWEEARGRLSQAELAIELSKQFPGRVSPWMLAYAQDVRGLLEALGESTNTGGGDEAVAD